MIERPNWTAAAALKLRIVARPGAFVILAPVFAVGVLGPTLAIEGNAVLLGPVVGTVNTNTVIGLERAVILASASATGAAGDVTGTA